MIIWLLYVICFQVRGLRWQRKLHLLRSVDFFIPCANFWCLCYTEGYICTYQWQDLVVLRKAIEILWCWVMALIDDKIGRHTLWDGISFTNQTHNILLTLDNGSHGEDGYTMADICAGGWHEDPRTDGGSRSRSGLQLWRWETCCFLEMWHDDRVFIFLLLLLFFGAVATHVGSRRDHRSLWREATVVIPIV